MIVIVIINKYWVSEINSLTGATAVEYLFRIWVLSPFFSEATNKATGVESLAGLPYPPPPPPHTHTPLGHEEVH